MDPGNLLLPFGKRNCGRAEPDATRNALSDAALRCDDCAVGDFNVTDNAYLARYRNMSIPRAIISSICGGVPSPIA